MVNRSSTNPVPIKVFSPCDPNRGTRQVKSSIASSADQEKRKIHETIGKIREIYSSSANDDKTGCPVLSTPAPLSSCTPCPLSTTDAAGGDCVNSSGTELKQPRKIYKNASALSTGSLKPKSRVGGTVTLCRGESVDSGHHQQSFEFHRPPWLMDQHSYNNYYYSKNRRSPSNNTINNNGSSSSALLIDNNTNNSSSMSLKRGVAMSSSQSQSMYSLSYNSSGSCLKLLRSSPMERLDKFLQVSQRPPIRTGVKVCTVPVIEPSILSEIEELYKMQSNQMKNKILERQEETTIIVEAPAKVKNKTPKGNRNNKGHRPQQNNINNPPMNGRLSPYLHLQQQSVPFYVSNLVDPRSLKPSNLYRSTPSIMELTGGNRNSIPHYSDSRNFAFQRNNSSSQQMSYGKNFSAGKHGTIYTPSGDPKAYRNGNDYLEPEWV